MSRELFDEVWYLRNNPDMANAVAEGWVPAPNTPIPVNFVPVEGEKLVVPPSVEVPDDVELPPT